MDFLSFLAESQRLIEWSSDGTQMLYVTISNESCDLDSCISTLAIAFFRFRNRGPTKHNFMPLLNMLRRDFYSKVEVRFLFEKYGILPDRHLIFRDDVPEELLLRCRFILVNHHVSPFHYGTEEVYDYRPYQEEAARLPVFCQRFMNPLRSCAALVTERYASTIYNFVMVRCPIVFELLHAALLMENCNFVKVQNLLQDRDFQMLMFLERYLGELQPDERNMLHSTLINATFNLSQLTLPQILRREFKMLRATNGIRLVRLAQCCFPMAVTRYISYEFSHLALQEFATEQACDYILLLGSSMHPGGGLSVKELGLIPTDRLRDIETRRIFDHLIINLNAASTPHLNLEPYRHLDFMQGAFFFIGSWDISFSTMLDHMQRILYDWVSQEVH